MNHSEISQNLELSAFQGRGTVDQAVTPFRPGRIYFKASYWPAQFSQTSSFEDLPPGAPVEVVGREGLTLLIQPIAQ